ncbi:MAG: NUDIX domain-containing protein [Anaerolineae bacterium]|nr:NUDIX domain-containing protein [Anaerolineae bacterium]
MPPSRISVFLPSTSHLAPRTSLRLGVGCAVIDDEGHLLLSQRGDLNVWNLPGGRLDSGEHLADAAAREVREETGVIPRIERAVGLYYLAGWERLNIVYAGWPLGGELQSRTDETRANRYFSPDELPEMFWGIAAHDALADTRPEPRIIQTPPRERRRIKTQLRWRWIKNLLCGRPEPRFPRFQVSAVALVWNDLHLRVLTLPNANGHTVPRVTCDGRFAPWVQLASEVHRLSGIDAAFQWVGLWQDSQRDHIELIFAATAEEIELSDEAEWTTISTAALDSREMDYVERVRPSYHHDLIWTINHDSNIKSDETLVIEEKK